MSNRYEITGTIKEIHDAQTFSWGDKRDFVLTDDDQKYPQDIKFELVKEKTALLDGLQPGTPITVAFNIRGNEWNGKYYVNLQAWRVTQQGQAQEPTEPPPTDHSDLDDLGF